MIEKVMKMGQGRNNSYSTKLIKLNKILGFSRIPLMFAVVMVIIRIILRYDYEFWMLENYELNHNWDILYRFFLGSRQALLLSTFIFMAWAVGLLEIFVSNDKWRIRVLIVSLIIMIPLKILGDILNVYAMIISNYESYKWFISVPAIDLVVLISILNVVYSFYNYRKIKKIWNNNRGKSKRSGLFYGMIRLLNAQMRDSMENVVKVIEILFASRKDAKPLRAIEDEMFIYFFASLRLGAEQKKSINLWLRCFFY